MSNHRFGYFLREGLRNMFSHGFMSFAAIGVTVACLVIMGTFTLVAVNANALLVDLEQENLAMMRAIASFPALDRPGRPDQPPEEVVQDID